MLRPRPPAGAGPRAGGSAFGRFAAVEGDEERLVALEAFTEKLLPGRWVEVRPPSQKELKATAILRMTIEEASAKVRSGRRPTQPQPATPGRNGAGAPPHTTLATETRRRSRRRRMNASTEIETRRSLP